VHDLDEIREHDVKPTVEEFRFENETVVEEGEVEKVKNLQVDRDVYQLLVFISKSLRRNVPQANPRDKTIKDRNPGLCQSSSFTNNSCMTSSIKVESLMIGKRRTISSPSSRR
jgi:hypothetical protein